MQSLQGGEALALVPYADFINHSPFSSAYTDARESGSWLFKDSEQEIILYADRGCRKIEQVSQYYYFILFLNDARLISRVPEWNNITSLRIPQTLCRFTYLTAPNQILNSYYCMDLLWRKIRTTRPSEQI